MNFPSEPRGQPGADLRIVEDSLKRPPENLSLKITAISVLSSQQLRDEWQRLYRTRPPRMGRDLLIRSLAYRVQELAYGGLSKAAIRQLAAVTKEMATTADAGLSPQSHLRPGARLVREWRGRTHTVVVTESGFEYSGATYSSLTKVAQQITGAHWSGPRFFGCTPKQETAADLKQKRPDCHAESEADHV